MQNKISYISNDDTGVKFKLISFCRWSLKARRCDCHNVLLLKVKAILAFWASQIYSILGRRGNSDQNLKDF